jgi:hypothetical protein
MNGATDGSGQAASVQNSCEDSQFVKTIHDTRSLQKLEH